MICKQCKRERAARASGSKWVSYRGRSEIVLADIDDRSVDAIITDPPYGTGANSASGRLAASSKKYRNSDATPLPDIAGDSLLPSAWNAMMRAVWAECFRVAADGCEVLAFCDWRSMSDMLDQVTGAGFAGRAVLVWNKGRGCRPNKNGFRSQSELIVWARKGKARARENAVYLDGVFDHPTMNAGKQHLTQKPLALMRDLIEIATPDSLVLDPFQGVATTGVAAIEGGHRYIGIEATDVYHDLAVKRLKEASRSVAR